ncbi:hypothetical protein B0H13DRAFT_1929366 [Mycena leptocephala]|nr:hypothetical protein B0H13DRAFT_1929366 [Mycena leptocephala]
MAFFRGEMSEYSGEKISEGKRLCSQTHGRDASLQHNTAPSVGGRGTGKRSWKNQRTVRTMISLRGLRPQLANIDQIAPNTVRTSGKGARTYMNQHEGHGYRGFAADATQAGILAVSVGPSTPSVVVLQLRNSGAMGIKTTRKFRGEAKLDDTEERERNGISYANKNSPIFTIKSDSAPFELQGRLYHNCAKALRTYSISPPACRVSLVSVKSKWRAAKRVQGGNLLVEIEREIGATHVLVGRKGENRVFEVSVVDERPEQS